ncbi:MAG: carboxylesterase family protein, partial [Myxococcota bacterium]
VGSASETLPLSSGQPIYSGKYFADKRDVVVVTIQYRLGVFGFLAHPDLTAEEATSGTYAHLDQIEALKWVQRNIARFGGDPSRVMLFGESAGAVNTCTLLASPLAKDLFSAALMQSGTCAAETLADIEAEHKAVTDTIAECAGATNTLDCLRRLPKETLARAMPSSVGVGADRGTPGSRVRFGPVVDGRLLTDDPIAVFRRGEHNKAPFAIGSNAEEMRESRLLTLRVSTAMEYENTIRLIGLAFGIGAADQILATYPVSDYPDPQTALEQVTTDASFTCPARSIARSLDAGQDDPVWRYFFSRQAELANGDRLPANHGIELIYVFESMRSIPGMRAQGDLDIADSMLNFWVNLAEFSTMNPPRVGGATWPEYDTARDTFLEFGDTVEAGEQLRAAKCNLWDSLVAGL